MEFTCTYCEKPINGVGILVDKTHFLHQGCEEAFNIKKSNLNYLKNKLEEKDAIDNAIKNNTLGNLTKEKNITFIKPI